MDPQVTKVTANGEGRIDLENLESGTGRLTGEAELVRQGGEGISFAAGDVLFGKLRPYLRKVMLCTDSGACSPELLVLRPRRDLLESRFLFYLALSEPFVAWAVATSKGTKMPRTTFDWLGDFRVGLPGLDQQRRIADFLDAETARIQRLIALRSREIGLLRERVKRLLTSIVVDLPRNARLAYAVAWLSGGTPPKDDPSNWLGEVPWATTKDLAEDRIGDTVDHITSDAAQEHSRIAPASSVLVATRGMALAKRLPLAIIDRQMAFNQDLKALVPARGLDADFLRLCLRAYEGDVLGDVAEAAHGTRRLETSSLKALQLPMPSLPMQRTAVDRAMCIEREHQGLIASLERQVNLLAERRQALITAAVTGEIDPAIHRSSAVEA